MADIKSKVPRSIVTAILLGKYLNKFFIMVLYGSIILSCLLTGLDTRTR